MELIDSTESLADGGARSYDHPVEQHMTHEKHACVIIYGPALARVASDCPIRTEIFGKSEIGYHEDFGRQRLLP